jgi:hypothetical protein
LIAKLRDQGRIAAAGLLARMPGERSIIHASSMARPDVAFVAPIGHASRARVLSCRAAGFRARASSNIHG